MNIDKGLENTLSWKMTYNYIFFFLNHMWVQRFREICVMEIMNGSSSFQDRREKPVGEDPIDSQLLDTGKLLDLLAMFTHLAKTVA